MFIIRIGSTLRIDLLRPDSADATTHGTLGHNRIPTKYSSNVMAVILFNKIPRCRAVVRYILSSQRSE